MKAKKAIAKVVKNVTAKMAIDAGGSASHWGLYQPKEPKLAKKK